ncbi:uncharacterized protein LOC135702642 [Ochlerotatus camptorhynchus]|uniref:uncharacterized protein LOC135702642 n=1 Tax=Ochlerotatus camptorhynchus TaxID=644619 RepID=UPI0031CE949D
MNKLLLTGASIICFVFSHGDEINDLDLCVGNLTSIDGNSEVFKNAPSGIMYISLCKNDLMTIDKITFLRFNHLESLILDKNRRLRFPGDGSHFLELKSLIDLQCFQCGVDRIYNHSLQGMPRLDQINLSDNVIEKIEVGAFYGNMQLEQIDLRSNQLRRVPSEMLTPLVSIRRIDLSLNVELAPGDSEPFLISTALENLRCDECGFVTVQKYTFAMLPNLKKLYLRRNKISQIHGLAFPQLDLTILMLESNALKSIDPCILKVMKLKMCLDDNTNELLCYLKDLSDQERFICSNTSRENTGCMVPSTTTFEVTNGSTDPGLSTIPSETIPNTDNYLASIVSAPTTENIHGIIDTRMIGHLILIYLTLIVIFVLLVGVWFKLKKKDTTWDSGRFTESMSSRLPSYESVGMLISTDL